MKLAGPLLAFLALQPPSVQLLDGHLSQIASRAAESAANAWNLRIELSPSGEGIRSLPSGRITASSSALRELLTGVAESQSEAVITWVMAHEVWHQAQYRSGFTLAAPDSAKRLFECEADVMATHHVTDRALRQSRSAPSERESLELGASLKAVMTTMERLEAGFGGVLSHPPAPVRQMAIRAGAGRAVHDRLSELASEPEDRLVRDRLGRIHDIRSEERIDQWASRMCRLLLHEGDGVPSLVLGDSVIRWNTSGDPPVVDYLLPFRNRGGRPIRVTMQIRSASVPRDRREDIPGWTFADARLVEFDLQPGATFQVSGRLDWYASDELMPRLLYPGSQGSLYDAALLGAAVPTTAPTSVMEVPAELLRLKGLFEAIYNDAANRFRRVAPPCPREAVDHACPLRAQVPGIIEAEATREPDGASEVYLLIYEGASEADSTRLYRTWREKLIRLYPATRIDYSTRPDSERTALQPHDRASFLLTRRQRTSGEYVVFATISPELE